MQNVMFQSTQDNSKRPKQLESGFKRTVNWNKYGKPIFRYSNSSFQWINRLLFYHSKIGMIEKVTKGIIFQP